MSETRIRLDKQIQKAPMANMIPLSNASGELQFVPLEASVKSAETLTHLDSVEVVNGNIVIKYTPENGVQQVLSAALPIPPQDINVANAVMENPGAGIYRLVITETDQTQTTVDLSALLAVVTQDTQYLRLAGNGTPEQPLRVEFSDQFESLLTKNLNQLEDVTVNPALIADALAQNGKVVLAWDVQSSQWIPKSIKTLSELQENTETFREMTQGNSVSLALPLAQIVPQSIKVFRNGLRQDLGEDYSLNAQGNQILFNIPFEGNYPEKVIVDYRPIV
jgi:hypothetical protein